MHSRGRNNHVEFLHFKSKADPCMYYNNIPRIYPIKLSKHLQCNPKNPIPNAALKSNQSTAESVNHTTYSINNHPISEEDGIKGPQAKQAAVSALS
jgi:hypothetical protein